MDFKSLTFLLGDFLNHKLPSVQFLSALELFIKGFDLVGSLGSKCVGDFLE